MSTDNDVYPVTFFPIFKTISYFAPGIFYPVFTDTAMPTCPNDNHYDWQATLDSIVGFSYFSLDAVYWDSSLCFRFFFCRLFRSTII